MVVSEIVVAISNWPFCRRHNQKKPCSRDQVIQDIGDDCLRKFSGHLQLAILLAMLITITRSIKRHHCYPRSYQGVNWEHTCLEKWTFKFPVFPMAWQPWKYLFQNKILPILKNTIFHLLVWENQWSYCWFDRVSLLITSGGGAQFSATGGGEPLAVYDK